MQRRVCLRLDIHSTGGRHRLGAFLFGSCDSVHFFIFIQRLKVLFHLRDFILKMKQNAMVHALEASIQWWECRFILASRVGEMRGNQAVA